MSSQKHSRRTFMWGSTAAALAGCFPEVGGSWPSTTDACRDESDRAPLSGSSKVVEVHRADAVAVDPTTQRTTIEPLAVQAMLAAALAELVPSGAPWRTLVPELSASTRVGIKVNVLNEGCFTSVELVAALVKSLQAELGLSAENIIVWDRRLDELSRVGFTADAVGARVLGTIHSTSDSGGPGYGEPTCGVVAGKAPRLSRILTDLTDLTINVPVLKTHAICGVTAALKNVYGVIDNPGDYHQNLNVALPELYRLPPIRNRLRFTVLDALIAVTTGGTSSPPDTIPRRLVLSADPLALDSYALALADQLRADKGLGLPPVDRSATGWLENAYQGGLGRLEYQLAALKL